MFTYVAVQCFFLESAILCPDAVMKDTPLPLPLQGKSKVLVPKIKVVFSRIFPQTSFIYKLFYEAIINKKKVEVTSFKYRSSSITQGRLQLGGQRTD